MSPATPALCLVADVGGTYVRFALSQAGLIQINSVLRLKTANFPSLLDATRYFLKQHSQPIDRACFAVAGPVGNEKFQLSNGAWNDSATHLRDALQLSHVRLINDFEAIALAVPLLAVSQQAPIGVSHGEITHLSPQSTVVIGPGTGFGNACLVHTPIGPIVVAGEGGHSVLSPENPQEMALLDWLAQHGYTNECEAFISGPGIELMHRALCDIAGLPQCKLGVTDIVQRALNDDAHCQRTLHQFCAWLGSVARDYALKFGAHGGVYIAGGVVSHFAQFLQQSAFRARFENCKKMHRYLRAIPTYLVTAENPGLMGAAWLCNQ